MAPTTKWCSMTMRYVRAGHAEAVSRFTAHPDADQNPIRPASLRLAGVRDGGDADRPRGEGELRQVVYVAVRSA